MALALLDSLGSERKGARFRIDTGTNRYYQLKVGRAKERRAGLDWIDQVVFSTPVAMNPSGGELLSSATNVIIPAQYFDGGHAYVQLFTFKTAAGVSPASSRVLLVPTGFEDGLLDIDIEESLSRSTSMNTTTTFAPARSVSCRTGAQVYAQQASIGDLLGEIAKIAGPIVANLFAGSGAPGPVGSAPGAAAGSASGTGAAAGTPFDTIGRVLQAILGALQPAAAHSGTQSLSIATSNRFDNGRFSRPFIFGIDDALIASLVGPVLQVLPQLMNSVNQNRLQMKQTQNQMITNLVSGVNQRMMIDKLLEAQRQASAAQPGGGADLSALIQLLQQAPAGGAAPPAPPAPPAPAVGQSLSLSEPQAPESQVSARAVLSFVTAAPIPWNGAPTLMFSKAQPVQLKVQLKVNGRAPARPLARAIVRLAFKDDSTQSVWLEKSFKQTNVAADAVIPLSFTQDELARLPTNKPMAVLAELRWPGPQGQPARAALGSIDIVVADKYFLKAQGAATSREFELTDMQRFRPFWNKVWEAPTLDASQKSSDEKKYLWALNVTAKYSMLLAPDAEANGLMDTRVLQGKPDPDSLTDAAEGRMKAGIELGLAELNKLLPILDDRPALDRDRLQALATQTFARNNAGEFVQTLKLKGKAGERGMIWVVPVFRLFELTLGSVQKIDDTGQVHEVADETVAFPLPVAARIIGLKSQ